MFDEWEICSYGTIPYLSTSKAICGNPEPHPADEKVPETFSNPSKVEPPITDHDPISNM